MVIHLCYLEGSCPVERRLPRWVKIGIAWDTEAREEEWTAFIFHTLGETESLQVEKWLHGEVAKSRGQERERWIQDYPRYRK